MAVRGGADVPTVEVRAREEVCGGGGGGNGGNGGGVRRWLTRRGRNKERGANEDDGAVKPIDPTFATAAGTGGAAAALDAAHAAAAPAVNAGVEREPPQLDKYTRRALEARALVAERDAAIAEAAAARRRAELSRRFAEADAMLGSPVTRAASALGPAVSRAAETCTSCAVDACARASRGAREAVGSVGAATGVARATEPIDVSADAAGASKRSPLGRVAVLGDGLAALAAAHHLARAGCVVAVFSAANGSDAADEILTRPLDGPSDASEGGSGAVWDAGAAELPNTRAIARLVSDMGLEGARVWRASGASRLRTAVAHADGGGSGAETAATADGGSGEGDSGDGGDGGDCRDGSVRAAAVVTPVPHTLADFLWWPALTPGAKARALVAPLLSGLPALRRAWDGQRGGPGEEEAGAGAGAADGAPRKRARRRRAKARLSVRAFAERSFGAATADALAPALCAALMASPEALAELPAAGALPRAWLVPRSGVGVLEVLKWAHEASAAAGGRVGSAAAAQAGARDAITAAHTPWYARRRTNGTRSAFALAGGNEALLFALRGSLGEGALAPSSQPAHALSHDPSSGSWRVLGHHGVLGGGKLDPLFQESYDAVVVACDANALRGLRIDAGAALNEGAKKFAKAFDQGNAAAASGRGRRTEARSVALALPHGVDALPNARDTLAYAVVAEPDWWWARGSREGGACVVCPSEQQRTSGGYVDAEGVERGVVMVRVAGRADAGADIAAARAAVGALLPPGTGECEPIGEVRLRARGGALMSARAQAAGGVLCEGAEALGLYLRAPLAGCSGCAGVGAGAGDGDGGGDAHASRTAAAVDAAVGAALQVVVERRRRLRANRGTPDDDDVDDDERAGLDNARRQAASSPSSAPSSSALKQEPSRAPSSSGEAEAASRGGGRARSFEQAA